MVLRECEDQLYCNFDLPW